MSRAPTALQAIVRFRFTTIERIDDLVPPGTSVNDDDAGWTSPAVAQAWPRRRPLAPR